MTKNHKDFTHLRVGLCLSHIVKFIADHNYAKITMTETVQDLISHRAAVLQINWRQLSRSFGGKDGGTHLKCFQIAHVVDEDIGVHRSQPQRMSVVPFGEVVSRKSLLAILPCQLVECLFFISMFPKQTGGTNNTHMCPHGRSVELCCVFVSHYFGTRMKSKYETEKSLWHLMAAQNGGQNYDTNMKMLFWFLSFCLFFEELKSFSGT